jgi:hypothetical protein
MNRFFENKNLPSELSIEIFHIRNKMIQAEKEEGEFQRLINADKLIELTAADIIKVPFNNGYKPLRDIDILRDGYNGNIWRHPNSGLNKPETLVELYKDAMEKFDANLDAFDGNLLDDQHGGMVNKKVKKREKKKIILGKERCIYKVSGSKKDYMKYKGKLVPVTDYIKSMKKKN